MSWRRDGGTIAGGIAAALGKGFLIACAGFTVAALFGAPAAAASGLWSIVATAAAGSTCLLAATAIRREQCNADEETKQQMRHVIELVRKLPDIWQIERDKPERTANRSP